MKIDSLGNNEWGEVYGTVNEDRLYSMCKTHDGNYILGGIGFYFIKINDDGDTIWQRSISGCANINDIESTKDNGFLLPGESRNNCSETLPNKTEANLGRFRTWFVKTNSVFNKLWDKTVFFPDEDYYGITIETPNNCYVAARLSKLWTGGYKSQPNWDSINNTTDFWIVKLREDPTLIPSLCKGEGVLVYRKPRINEVATWLQKEPVQEAT